MGKDGGFLTPKAISNRIKAQGLQKLRWSVFSLVLPVIAKVHLCLRRAEEAKCFFVGLHLHAVVWGTQVLPNVRKAVSR